MLGVWDDAVLDVQLELLHRLAPTQSPRVYQSGIIAPHLATLGQQRAGAHPTGDTTLQPRNMQYADHGEERLVERRCCGICIDVGDGGVGG